MAYFCSNEIRLYLIADLYFIFQTLTSAFRQHDTDQDGVIQIHYEQFLQMVLNTKV